MTVIQLAKTRNQSNVVQHLPMKRSRTRKGRLVDSQRRLLDQQKQEKNMVTNKLSCGTSCTCARCQATAEFFGVTERRRENQSKVGREGEYDLSVRHVEHY